MISLTQRHLDYFNDKRNYHPGHQCHYMGCMCPPNGMYWKEYDEWVRIGRPYTLDEVVEEVDQKNIKRSESKFICDKYTIGFLCIMFILMLSLCLKN
jgi:hypothetical protein